MAITANTYKIQASSEQDYWGLIGYLTHLGLNPQKTTGSMTITFSFQRSKFYPPVAVWDENDARDWARDKAKLEKLFSFTWMQ